MAFVTWGDPFVEIDKLIDTPDQATFWLQFLTALRDGVLIPPNEWISDEELRRAVCVDLYESVRLVRDAARDPEVQARAVCLIELWSVRTRLEWGLK
jgi:hypothetical protein